MGVDDYCSIDLEKGGSISVMVRVKNCHEVLETTFKGMNNHIRLHFLRKECQFIGNRMPAAPAQPSNPSVEELSQVEENPQFVNLDQTAPGSSSVVVTGLVCVAAVALY